ncbi:hypothetical protein BaRGS_00030710 [Batillaria attramentaria]|uniref:AIG1-type G domain-containing protein n=1 Tax=Batillaria attramentaria TaxID=370345 RepID=A0ABD0JTL9_9CAEN
MACSGALKQIRVVLIGKTGAGKSSLGNSLIGPKHFKVGRGLSSETTECSYNTGSRDNFEFQVVDTPGLCDTHRPEEDIYREVGKSVALATPGPHIILMVLRCDRRFTKEEYDAYAALKKLFSDTMCRHMIVIFNGLDTFAEDDDDEPDLSELRAALELQMMPGKASDKLRQVINESQGGYFGMNNKASKAVKDQQMKDLVDKMVTLMQQNGNACYSSDLVEEINRRIDEMVRERMRMATNKTEAQVTEEVKGDISKGKVSPGLFESLGGMVKYAAERARSAASDICAVM